MKKIATTLLLCVSCLLFYSCSKPKDFEYRDFRNVKIETIGFGESTLGFDLVYYNPNGFGIDLRRVDSEVFIDSLYLGKFQLDTLMHINRMSEFVLPGKIRLDMKNLLKNSARFLLKKEVTVQAKGTVRAGRGGVFKTIPFNYEGKHAMSLF